MSLLPFSPREYCEHWDFCLIMANENDIDWEVSSMATSRVFWANPSS
jgi:hypothetical protein